MSDNNGNWLNSNINWNSTYNTIDNFILPNRELAIICETNYGHISAFAQWAPNNTIIGDINLDGVIFNSDLTPLLTYLSGTNTLSIIQMYTADYDQNGIIDINDATALQLFLDQ